MQRARHNCRAAMLTNPELPAAAWVARFLPLIRPGGSVLDLAAGSGRHTRLLLRHGYRVRAVDRDVSALTPLAGANCSIEQIDLETGAPWPLGGGYDGVIVTNYLYRPHLRALAGTLAPGGAVIYETFMLGNERFGRPRSPEFLLHPGELIEAFAGLAVVAFEQGEVDTPRPAMIQRIAALNGPVGRLPDTTRRRAAASLSPAG